MGRLCTPDIQYGAQQERKSRAPARPAAKAISRRLTPRCVRSGDRCDRCSGLFGGSSIDWRCAIDSKDIFQKGGVRQQAMLTSRRADKLQRDRKTIGGETARQRQDRKRRKRQTVTN